jgi:lysophospholipase L1-like esterase
VIGDSTAAGLGNRPVEHASASDKACRRSQDAFALDLAQANDWQITNLACSGATIPAGLLGPQDAGGRTIAPQLDAHAVANSDLVVVSIGANDVNWSLILRLCAISRDCANNAEQALFQQQLAEFSRSLLQLVSALQLLPNHPVVIINEYYDPFAGDTGCLARHGITDAKKRTLQSELSALNDTLAQSAKAAGFRLARPDFDGHGVCSHQPYVQGLDDPAPFHPTSSGELAIALADEQALHAQAGR